MTCTAPVYQYACPRCLEPLGEPCIRVRRIRAQAPETLLNPHKERYAVWHAWERDRQFSLDLPLYSVRKTLYKDAAE